MRRRNVRYGIGAFGQVAEVVRELGARSVLLVCGKTSFEASGAARALPDLQRVAKVHRWSDFVANTDAADAVRGLHLVAETEPDVILGVGGGSAMDMAKLLCAFAGVTEPSKLHEAIRNGEPVPRRDRHLILAPTTSGSGSEATHFAVVYIGTEKFSVAGPALLPDAVLLDPALTMSGSAYQRATSGIDAVAQAIESLWAVGATSRSRLYSRHALSYLLQAIETHVASPTTESARAMAIGSHLAGRAINISKTTAAHALSYHITKHYGISHGHAVALTLGAFIEAHANASPETLQRAIAPDVHAASIRLVLDSLGARDAQDARRRFDRLAERIGLPMGLRNIGVNDAKAMNDLVESANIERLSNNPVRFDTAALVTVVGSASEAT